jgi:hypothetical protein
MNVLHGILVLYQLLDESNSNRLGVNELKDLFGQFVLAVLMFKRKSDNIATVCMFHLCLQVNL